MSDSSPGLVSSLPSRPLTVQEGNALEQQETDSVYVRPESIILQEDEEIVVALGAVDRHRGIMYLVGYSPDTEGWSVVDQWDEAELEKDRFYERLDEWEAETFAEGSEYGITEDNGIR